LKFKQGLIDTLKDLNIKRKNEEGYSKDHFNLQDLSTSLSFIEADFTVKENDYLKMQLFKETFDIDRLDMNSIMKIFDSNHFENNCTFYTAEILSPKSPKNPDFYKGTTPVIKEDGKNLFSILVKFSKKSDCAKQNRRTRI